MKLKFKIFRESWKCIVLILFCVTMSNAQSVSGTVTADGQPLPGATVLLKGTTKATSTDLDGKFTVAAAAQNILVFSYIGYATKEVSVGSKKQINVVLESDNKLDEVVVIGYGTQRKSDLTGSVSSVSAKDLTVVPVSRVDQALQGRATGVQVTQNSGAPGAPTSIRIRGGNSITGSNEPLWVIDGIIVGNNFNLNNINSNDIKSIEILKDASSIAIYGSRGANGVVLVTTKNGSSVKGGEPQISVGVFTSTQLVPERPKFLSQPEQIKYTNEDARFRGVAEPFPGDPSSYPDNDFFDLLLKPSPIFNADVSASGTSKDGDISYFNSINFFNQDGLIENSGIEKYIVRSNLDFKLTDKLKAGIRFNYSRLKQKNGVVDYGGLLNILPTQPVYNDDGTFNGFNNVVGAPFNNPVATAQLDIDETTSNNLLGTLYLEYKPISNLIIRSTFNPNITDSKRNELNSSKRPDFLSVSSNNANAKISGFNSFNWNNENTIQYNTNVGDNHRMTFLGGASFQKETTETYLLRAFGLTTDAVGFNNIGLGTDQGRNIVDSRYPGATQLVSFFSRVNYDYKEKYLFTLVGRYDGTSVFAKGNQWGFYPSVAAAWKISEEPFMQNQNIVHDLKLRTSYGQAGNQTIGPNETKSIFDEANTTLNGVQQPGVSLGRPENAGLGWETTTSFDVALEASFFKGRIFTEFNYYHKRTDDLLLNVTIPKQTGFANQLQNVGALQNKGWEFLVKTTNIQKPNFNWNSTLTLSSNKNKVLDLGGKEFIDVVVDQILGAGNLRIIKGETVPVFTGVRYLGTWKSQAEIDASGLAPGSQVVGGPKFENLNGDNVISTADFVPLGNPFPDLIFGFENSVSYKNFDLSFYVQGTLGNEVYNLRSRGNYFTRGENPKFAEIADRWTPENPNSDILRAGSDGTTAIPSNSKDVEDGSHLRLKNVRFAYNLPVDKMGIKGVKNISVYLSGTNLLLLSNFRLIDPESSRFGKDGLGNIAQGFSNGEYPNAKVLTLGLNVTF